MSLVILLYFLWAQHVSGTTMRSSGARDYDVDYHIERFVLDLLYVVGCIPDTTPAYPHLISNTESETTNVVINIIVASSWWWP